jgi:hypothetical protein
LPDRAIVGFYFDGDVAVQEIFQMQVELRPMNADSDDHAARCDTLLVPSERRGDATASMAVASNPVFGYRIPILTPGK